MHLKANYFNRRAPVQHEKNDQHDNPLEEGSEIAWSLLHF